MFKTAERIKNAPKNAQQETKEYSQMSHIQRRYNRPLWICCSANFLAILNDFELVFVSILLETPILVDPIDLQCKIAPNYEIDAFNLMQ